MQVVDAGAVVLLVLCVQEPELSLKRVAASALSDIAKHTPELAQAVVDAGMLLLRCLHCLLCSSQLSYPGRQHTTAAFTDQKRKL